MFNEPGQPEQLPHEAPELLEGVESLAVRLVDPRRRLFVQEYLVDCNGPKAAQRSGYSIGASTLLLRDPAVLAAIQIAQAQRLTRTQITQDQVLMEMSLLALSNVEHYVIDDEGNVTLAQGAPEGAMRAIQSIDKKVTVRTVGRGEDAYIEKTYDVKLKLWDKPTPLRLMGRHVGLFPDKVEVTGANGGPIETVTRIERRIVDPVVEDYVEGQKVLPETTH